MLFCRARNPRTATVILSRGRHPGAKCGHEVVDVFLREDKQYVAREDARKGKANPSRTRSQGHAGVGFAKAERSGHPVETEGVSAGAENMVVRNLDLSPPERELEIIRPE